MNQKKINHISIQLLIAVSSLFGTVTAWAIDNPDQANLSEAFEIRMKPLEDAFSRSSTNSDITAAGIAYGKALDTELNQAYQSLLSKLNSDGAQKLRTSQRAWLSHLRAEKSFIESNWSRAHFGDSSTLSRWDYQNTLIKARTLVLLRYLQNY